MNNQNENKNSNNKKLFRRSYFKKSFSGKLHNTSTVFIDFSDPTFLLLQKMVAQQESRGQLVSLLIRHSGDLIMKIRFCSAVMEYEATNSKLVKDSKGRKIVNLFVEEDSRFRIVTIPQCYLKGLLLDQLDYLIPVKNEFLMELSQMEQVKVALDKLVVRMQTKDE